MNYDIEEAKKLLEIAQDYLEREKSLAKETGRDLDNHTGYFAIPCEDGVIGAATSNGSVIAAIPVSLVGAEEFVRILGNAYSISKYAKEEGGADEIA